MAEVLTVLTFKSAHHIISDGGTQSWAIGKPRAEKCAYVVCARHQQGPYKAEGNEPHKHAFLVGKVRGVSPSTETKNRWMVEISEYAIIDGPKLPLFSASPTQYFPSLKSLSIDEAGLDWKPLHEVPSEGPQAVNLTAASKDTIENGSNDMVPMSVIMQAKKLVADGLHVPMSAVEIIVRG